MYIFILFKYIQMNSSRINATNQMLWTIVKGNQHNWHENKCNNAKKKKKTLMVQKIVLIFFVIFSFDFRNA